MTVVKDGETAKTTYTYDANNRLLKELMGTVATGEQSVTGYSYDPNGNQILKTYSGLHAKDLAAMPGIRLSIIGGSEPELLAGPVEKISKVRKLILSAICKNNDCLRS